MIILCTEYWPYGSCFGGQTTAHEGGIPAGLSALFIVCMNAPWSFELIICDEVANPPVDTAHQPACRLGTTRSLTSRVALVLWTTCGIGLPPRCSLCGLHSAALVWQPSVLWFGLRAKLSISKVIALDVLVVLIWWLCTSRTQSH